MTARVITVQIFMAVAEASTAVVQVGIGNMKAIMTAVLLVATWARAQDINPDQNPQVYVCNRAVLELRDKSVVNEDEGLFMNKSAAIQHAQRDAAYRARMDTLDAKLAEFTAQPPTLSTKTIAILVVSALVVGTAAGIGLSHLK